MNFLGEEKFSTLPFKNKVADENKMIQDGKFSLKFSSDT
jgi:hypothetical protein